MRIGHPSAAPRSTRRGFLRAVAGLTGGVASAAALSACGVFGGGGGSGPPPSPELDSLLTETVALADRYDATLTAHTGLAGKLGPLRDAHHAHAAALAKALGRPVPAASGGQPEVPARQKEAVAALIKAEKQGHKDAAAACIATTARLAALVGSISAARASHLEVL